MNIYIGEPKTITISDMQGPCPDGFHIPLDNEWSGLGNIMYGLGLSGSNHWREKLHLPRVMTRSYNNGNITDQGYGQYWSSQLYTYGSYDDTAYCYTISNDTSSTGGSTVYVCSGLGIRPFYNNFVVPTSSWTVVNGTLGGAGIFWNQSEGIISITSNGTTGYTIADKNLGATTIYNNGDTLSESNCGKLYQWGNNYGFPYSGSVTTSSTRVDASGYGPGYEKGKYYESSTFIIRTSSPYSWYSNRNQNLWGGVSQGSSTKQVPQEVQNIYIGEYKGFVPGSNTVAYYKFDGDANDYSGNNRNLTATDITYNTLSSGLKVASLNGSSSYAIINNQSISMSECTLNIWIKRGQTSNSETWGSIGYGGDVAYRISPNSSTEGNLGHLLYANGWVFQGTNNTGISNGIWANYVSVTTSSGNKFYVNGQEVALNYSRGNSSTGFGTRNFNNIVIGKHPTISADRTKGEASNWIIENKARTAQEISDYYNQTKSNYGL